MRMECNLNGAPDGRRTPEAFGKDGCPEQHTGSSITLLVAIMPRPYHPAAEATIPPPSSSCPVFVAWLDGMAGPRVLVLNSGRLTPTRLRDEGERSRSSRGRE